MTERQDQVIVYTNVGGTMLYSVVRDRLADLPVQVLLAVDTGDEDDG